MCCCSVATSNLNPCNPMGAAGQASLSTTNSWNLLKLMCANLVMPSNHFILCRPLLFLLSIFPSIRVFSSEWAPHIRWPKYCNISSASVLPVNIQVWFPLGWAGLISLQSRGLSRVFSSTTVWKHQFCDTQTSLWYKSHICIWLLENHSFD